jgi:hypothetical protein
MIVNYEAAASRVSSVSGNIRTANLGASILEQIRSSVGIWSIFVLMLWYCSVFWQTVAEFSLDNSPHYLLNNLV